MYLSDALKVLWRQRVVVIIGVVLVAIAGIAALRVVQTKYQATGQVLLLPPSVQVIEGDPINPYMNLPSGLTLTAALLANAVSSPDVERDMVASGFRSGYSVSVPPGVGPLIVVVAHDTLPGEALRTRDELIRRIGVELERIQGVEEVSVDQSIAARPFVVSTSAEVLPGSKIKALAVIAAVGDTLTVLVAFVVDRIRRPRSTPEVSLVSNPVVVDEPPNAPGVEPVPTADTSVPDDASAEVPAKTSINPLPPPVRRPRPNKFLPRKLRQTRRPG